ncbi:DNA primase DnaG [Nanoarchaeota archaeon]
MAKIAQVSAKYIVHAAIEIEGVVDRPDVIGAVFGQTEGLLGQDLELRELQRSGRIGRIEVNTETKGGKTSGMIIVPSSLDKSETAIIGAALEVIQRIGPCNAKVSVQKIEDVRVSKRAHVVGRAKELLKNLMDSSMPDSQELSDEVAYSVRVMEIQEYGKDRLPCGPGIDEADEIILVEGRADVIVLLKHGFKNVISINGTSIPPTIIALTKEKVATVFVDGDRGGDLIIKELLAVAELDYVTKAPDGKEVEELTKKEIHKAIRGRIPADQAKHEVANVKPQPRTTMRTTQRSPTQRAPTTRQPLPRLSRTPPRFTASRPTVTRQPRLKEEDKVKFKEMLDDLVGTKGAYILDKESNILGKVPVTELATTIKSLNTGVYAIIFDGTADKEIVESADGSRVRFVVAMQNKIKPGTSKSTILTPKEL